MRLLYKGGHLLNKFGTCGSFDNSHTNNAETSLKSNEKLSLFRPEKKTGSHELLIKYTLKC